MLRIVATIAVVAAAIGAPFALGALGVGGLTTAAGGLTVGGALLTAGVGLGGMLLVNALAPPSGPRLSSEGEVRNSPTITGANNQARPYGRVPVVFGRHRVVPMYGAKPYTELVGDDQYLRLLFVVGYGVLRISDIRIGDTPISEFEGVELEVRQGYTTEDPLRLYPGQVDEQTLSILLTAAGSWQTRTSDDTTDEISVDVTFPRGLARYAEDGDRDELTVDVEVQYAVAGSGSWVTVNGTSPSFWRQMDYLFRTPECAFGGAPVHAARIGWSTNGAFPDAKPGYLPSHGYSWSVGGYIYAPTGGTYEFGVDGSDAIDLHIDGSGVVTWYGSHAPQGSGGVPNYNGHTGSVQLSAGWHSFRVRMESRPGSGTGAIAVAWRKPGDPGLDYIPASSFADLAGVTGQLTVNWFTTSGYTSTVRTQAARGEQIRRSLGWAVPRGQYDVRVRRVTADSSSDRDVDDVYWTALRSVQGDDPIKLPGLARIALRIKATDQLSGVVDTLNCIAESVLPDYDAGTGFWVDRQTRNPASIYRALLQGRGNARPLGTDRIDIAALQAWHTACAANGWTFDGVIDFPGTLLERLQDVCAAGRASWAMRDGLYSVARDRVQTTPVQHLTPRNSRGFRGRKAFPDLPHALRIRFLNAAAGYQQDERVVLDDGYQIDGKDAFGNDAPLLPPATKYETLELFGATTGELAWKHGRYHIAVARLRPEVYELTTDIEHLVCNKGDLVVVSHDVALWGSGAARVTQLMLDGSALKGLVLDEQIVMEAGRSYRVRVRLEDGTSFVHNVVTIPGVQTQVEFTGVPSAPLPKVGDLVMFGEIGLETRELVVRAIDIEPGDLAARLELVDHAPGVHLADQGPIPPWDSGITQPPPYEDRPETPVIVSVRSDETVMERDQSGTLQPRMLIVLRPPGGDGPMVTHAQVRTRPKPADENTGGGWTQHPIVPIDANQVYVRDVRQGVLYQIRLRTVTPDGRVSDWAAAEHTVVGNTIPPPDLATFAVARLSDGTRRYSWSFTVTPPDIAGVVIRYGPPGSVWAAMTPLHSGVLEASPSELNAPPAGTWRLAAKAQDVGGLQSTNPIYIDATLGEPRLEGVAFSDDAGPAGWLGTRTDCHPTTEGTLEADDQVSWSGLAGAGITSWATYTRWVVNPRSPISYESIPIDAGFILEFSPDCLAIGEGTVVTEVAWSTDGASYTAWAEVSTVRDVAVRARYLKARVTVTASGPYPIPVIRRVLTMMRAIEVRFEINDLVTSTLPAERVYGPGDVRLPVPVDLYQYIRGVSLGFNGMGGGWSWELVDRDALAGPRVRMYNTSGQLQHATIDAVVRGFTGTAGGGEGLSGGLWQFSDPAGSAQFLSVLD